MMHYKRNVQMERAVGQSQNMMESVGLTVIGFDKYKSEVYLQGPSGEYLKMCLDVSVEGMPFITVDDYTPPDIPEKSSSGNIGL